MDFPLIAARQLCGALSQPFIQLISSHMEPGIKAALADIESTADLLGRALKLAGLPSATFERRGFRLVGVGGSAVEFYSEPVRLSWKEWKAGRASRRNALAARGPAATCRRTTARPEAAEALKRHQQANWASSIP